MSKTPIQLSDHFTCRKLICFTLPSITMMIFTADLRRGGRLLRVQLRRQDPLCGGELSSCRVLLILGSVGFMFGTGGGALIAKTMGQGDRQRANRHLFPDRVRLGGPVRSWRSACPGLS